MNKTLLTLLSLFLFTFSSKAQYYPLLDSVNHWTIVGNGMVVSPHQSSSRCNYPYSGTGYQSYDFETTDDTLINGLTYKIVKLFDHSFTFDCDFGYVREDTALQKVYFIDNNFLPEIMLYDYSMNTGDSTYLSFTVAGGYFESGYYTVDSITSTNTFAGPRRVFSLSKHSSPFQYSMTWIESIGCLENPFYPYSLNMYGGLVTGCPGDQHSYIEYVSCFEHVGKVYYDSCAFATAMINSCFLVEDSCSYFNICGGIKELKDVTAFNLVPNPAHGESEINFEISSSGNYEFTVISSTGREIPIRMESGNLTAGKHQLKLNLTGLAAGLYFVRCKNKYGQVFQKLVVM